MEGNGQNDLQYGAITSHFFSLPRQEQKLVLFNDQADWHNSAIAITNEVNLYALQRQC